MTTNVGEQGNVNAPMGKQVEEGKDAPAEDELKQPIIQTSTPALQPILKSPSAPKYSGQVLATAQSLPKKEP